MAQKYIRASQRVWYKMRGGFRTRSDGQFVARSSKAAQNEILKQDITDTAASKGATAGQGSSAIPSISLPPLEFEYNQAAIQDKITKIDAESLENLPIGLDGSLYQWVDLDGEGLSGILTEQVDAWFYKQNMGGGEFGPLQVLAEKPSLTDLSSGRQQLIDLAGDGQLDLVELSGPVSGFYERTHDLHWERFTPFVYLPNVDWSDPNLKFVDLTGAELALDWKNDRQEAVVNGLHYLMKIKGR